MRLGTELSEELQRLQPEGWEHLWTLVVAHREEYLQAVLRRARSLTDEEIGDQGPTAETLVFNDRYRSVSWHGETTRLTKTEYRLITLLVRRGDWATVEELYQGVWGYSQQGLAVPELIRAHLRNIRGAFMEKGWPNPIRNRRGIGYGFAFPRDSVVFDASSYVEAWPNGPSR